MLIHSQSFLYILITFTHVFVRNVIFFLHFPPSIFFITPFLVAHSLGETPLNQDILFSSRHVHITIPLSRLIEPILISGPRKTLHLSSQPPSLPPHFLPPSPSLSHALPLSHNERGNPPPIYVMALVATCIDLDKCHLLFLFLLLFFAISVLVIFLSSFSSPPIVFFFLSFSFFNF